MHVLHNIGMDDDALVDEEIMVLLYRYHDSQVPIFCYAKTISKNISDKLANFNS